MAAESARSVIKRFWSDQLMLGHVLKLSTVGYEQFPCAQVRVRRNEFNAFLNMYFAKPTDFWALTKQLTIGIGDIVLIRKLDTAATPTVLHAVEKVIMQHGFLIDPITKKRVILKLLYIVVLSASRRLLLYRRIGFLRIMFRYLSFHWPFRMFSECPSQVDAADFIKQRAGAVGNLLAVIDNEKLPKGEVCQGPRTFIQRLPRHMRRRAMSHNVKRLPRRHRHRAEGLIEKSTHRSKPFCRRQRRRPSNLLRLYIRRQRKARWLETHIWHAKRFKMIEAWGYKLADKCFQRCWRASFRDSKRHCTIEDISYFICIELAGRQKQLINGLNELCSSEVGLTFAAVSVLRGHREGRVVLYEQGRYPYGCIGPCSFIWEPCDCPEDNIIRKIWIWVHPSIKTKILSSLRSLFHLGEYKSADAIMDTKKVNCLSDFRLLGSTRNCVLAPDGNISLVLLEDAMLRFRLSGPKSSFILRQVLDVREMAILLDKTATADGLPSETLFARWIRDFPASVSPLKAHVDFWLRSASLQPPDCIGQRRILSLLCSDPRIDIAYKKRLPADIELKPVSMSINELPFSPIWQEMYRLDLLRQKLPEKVINEARHRNVIRGTSVELGQVVNLIPLLLVCQSSSEAASCGWDVIAPAGWGMAFWTAIQYATARAVGLQFAGTFQRECGVAPFPDDWADSEAGNIAAKARDDEARAKYLSRPLKMRPSFSKLKIKYPFEFAWSELIDSWKNFDRRNSSPTDDEPYFVLRNKLALKRLSSMVTTEDWMANSLVRVSIESVGRGVPRRHALICLPNDEDLDRIVETKSSGCVERSGSLNGTLESDLSSEDGDTPAEIGVEKQIDFETLFPNPENVLARKKAEKKKLQKKKKQEKKVASSSSDVTSESVVHFGLRPVIGFVLDGGYSLLKGKGIASGLCSCLALNRLFSETKVRAPSGHMVLFRNTTSMYYRAAVLKVQQDD
ncbi:lissencephaly 1 [Trichuris trichiura]|uniref:Lissencephaly 1 n=1 Tax=Trichuris trichiura TaxID=36087 RepID=A0A077ZFG5_TRITR|nr:lissencephaly 1 [Trichuris trichiura]